jgi:hypothetical protein
LLTNHDPRRADIFGTKRGEWHACPQSVCVLCCEPIGASYLREIGTHLPYCDHNCYADHCTQEAEMRKLIFALVLFASSALAQTPNLSLGPPLEGVTDPVVCLPIGKTAKGDLVYSMECRDIPTSTGFNSAAQTVLPLPSEKAAAAPEKK